MRLTNDMRAKIARDALANVPVVDYKAKLVPVVQNVLYAHMPASVKDLYDAPATRRYLKTFGVEIREGNGYGSGRVYLDDDFFGLQDVGALKIRIGDEVLRHLKRGTLMYNLAKAVMDSGYFDAHRQQRELFDDVAIRLRNTLKSVNTVKRLYDVLEPELHHLIPKEGDKTANLPATVAPVVSDLRKLGANLPDVPTAKK